MADPDNTFKNHMITLKTLKGKKKYEFIWEYYKLHILAILIILLLLFSALNHFVLNPPKKTYANLSVYGGYVDSDVLTEMKTRLDELIIPEEEREDFEFLTDSYYMYDEDPQIKNAVIQKLIATLSYQGLDCLIIEKGFFADIAAEGFLMDLAECLTEKEIQALSSQGQNKIMYGQRMENDGTLLEERPYGISCENSAFLNELGFYSENVIISVVVNTKKPEIARSIVDVIIGLK